MSDKHARPFSDVLAQQSRAHQEATDGFHEVIAAVAETGKSGSVTITLKVEPDKKAEGIFRVTDSVKVTIPQFDRATNIYFRDSTGNLTRNNPNQPEIEGLRDVSAPVTPITLKEAK